MAKVLFVICVPVEENNTKAKRNGNTETVNADDVNGKEQNHNTLSHESCGKCSKSPPMEHKIFIESADTAESSVGEEEPKPDSRGDGDNVSRPRKGSLKGNSFLNIVGKKVLKTSSASALSKSNSSSKLFKNKSSSDMQKVVVDETDGQKKDDNNMTGSEQNSEEGGAEDDESEYISFVSDNMTLLQRVKAALQLLDIPAVNWSQTQDNIHVGMFIAGDGENCEKILDKLTYLDIGVIPKSSISVFPASISVSRDEQAEKLKLELEREDKLAEKISEFKKSIKSRLVVAQVVDAVKSDAVFTFDYLMLIILASMVAIMGLLEASSVSLVASMLISPLMGPIIAFVFGTVIRNMELLKIGFTSEMRGLSLCILVGFLSGFIPACLESAGLAWRSTDSWPTVEMSSRGAFRSLPVGVLIALPSGAGVALSILGGKVGSLVGVAISASLLPPAVNAGLLWANAIIVGIIPPHTVGANRVPPQNYSSLTSTESAYILDTTCPVFVNNDYVPIYSCNMAVESVVLGVISLLLTIVNIICIFIMGIVVLKIKEVAPIRSSPDAEKDFFAKDLKIARESYETTKGPNSAILGKKFLQEYKKFKEEIGVEDEQDTNSELNDILEDVEEADDVQEILDKLPHRPKRWSSYIEVNEKLAKNPYHTFHGGSIKPSSPDVHVGVRKRGSAVVSITPARTDDEGHSSYLTVHRYVNPMIDTYNSPRNTHRSPGRYLAKKLKGRFHVAKVEEDDHKEPEVYAEAGATTKVDKMPPIREQEVVPLLNVQPKEV